MALLLGMKRFYIKDITMNLLMILHCIRCHLGYFRHGMYAAQDISQGMVIGMIGIISRNFTGASPRNI